MGVEYKTGPDSKCNKIKKDGDRNFEKQIKSYDYGKIL